MPGSFVPSERMGHPELPANLTFDALRAKAASGVPEATCSATVADHPSPGYLRAVEPYEHVSVARGPGLRQLSVPHVIEVVPGRQFEAPDCDHTPAGLEELISVANLEGTHGVECMVEISPSGTVRKMMLSSART